MYSNLILCIDFIDIFPNRLLLNIFLLLHISPFILFKFLKYLVS
jgi:hypothetical protein